MSTIRYVDLDGQVLLGVSIIVVDHNVNWGLFSRGVVFLAPITSPILTYLQVIPMSTVCGGGIIFAGTPGGVREVYEGEQEQSRACL